MRTSKTWLVMALLLAGCGISPTTPGGGGGRANIASDNGGLPTSEAATSAVEETAPAGFVLTEDGGAFVAALATVVVPQRLQIATSLSTDTQVQTGLADWNSQSSAQQLQWLEHAAGVEATIMGATLPPISSSSGVPAVAGEMAEFDPPTGSGLGQITLYPQVITTSNAFEALDTILHETRHACQFQLVKAAAAHQLPTSDPRYTLASNYAAAWSALDKLGGESTLSYGDYAHLDVEYDAFQTGNEIAQLLAGGSLNLLGVGFVDAQYGSNGALVLDLANLVSGLTPPGLVGAVNTAEYNAEVSTGFNGAHQRHGLMRHVGAAERLLSLVPYVK